MISGTLLYLLIGNYNLQRDGIVIIAKHHLWRAYQHGVRTAVWTFNASIYYKIRFHFAEFYYYSSNTYYYVKIGDGLVRGESIRLRHHFQQTAPSDVTSPANTAWLEVYDTILSTGHKLSHF